MVFAAVATGLLPDLMGAHQSFALIIGFSLGVCLMLGIKSLTERAGLKGVSTAPADESDHHRRGGLLG